MDLVHEIRDAIHGFINYNDLEKDIIDSKPFQRLRYIKQLAFTDYVYPGASHTRFAHSLGVMEFATKIFNILLQKKDNLKLLQETLKWNDQDIERNRQLLRLGALLHDAGHAPFSHAVESLFKDGLRHEDFSEKIILQTEVGKIIDDNKDKTSGITKEDVASLISKEPLGSAAFLRQIISGQIDADRIDYLLRDSLYCGVDYGRFDYHRLIHTLALIPEETSGNPILAIEEGGLHSMEGLILARYFMFLQVYFHRVRRAYDIHLGDALKEILPEGQFPENLDEYLMWDDIEVMNLLRECQEKLKSACRILNRNHYRVAYSTGEHIKGAEVENFRLILREVRREFGDEEIREDAAQTSLYKFDKVALSIKPKDGSEYLRIEERSNILKHFNEPINQMRILTDKGIEDKVAELCEGIRKEVQEPRG